MRWLPKGPNSPRKGQEKLESTDHSPPRVAYEEDKMTTGPQTMDRRKKGKQIRIISQQRSYEEK